MYVWMVSHLGGNAEKRRFRNSALHPGGGGPPKKVLTQAEQMLEASRKVWSEKAVPKRKKEPEKTKKLSGPLGDFTSTTIWTVSPNVLVSQQSPGLLRQQRLLTSPDSRDCHQSRED